MFKLGDKLLLIADDEIADEEDKIFVLLLLLLTLEIWIGLSVKLFALLDVVNEEVEETGVSGFVLTIRLFDFELLLLLKTLVEILLLVELDE